jgi:hypothetical protein
MGGHFAVRIEVVGDRIFCSFLRSSDLSLAITARVTRQTLSDGSKSDLGEPGADLFARNL